MGEIYENPPLIEALCEFQFDSDKEWDWTIPGMLYDKIKSEFPNKKQQKAFVINVEQKKDSNITPQVSEGPQTDRIIFFNESNNKLIQVKPNVFTINLLNPYPGWQEFKKIIDKYLQLYIEVAQPIKLNRIGLRYINRISQIDLEDMDTFSDYFSINPSMLHGYHIGNFFVRNEIIYDELDSILLYNMGSSENQSGDNYIFLDFDFMTENSNFIQFENYQRWLEKAHENVEEAFNSSITKKLKEKFKEVE